MKVSYNDELVFELSKTKEKVICNDIYEDIFDKDMKRRLKYIIEHKYTECFKKLKDEWEPKLKEAGIKMFPVDEEEFAKLVFAQPNYESRKRREKPKWQKEEKETEDA